MKRHSIAVLLFLTACCLVAAPARAQLDPGEGETKWPPLGGGGDCEGNTPPCGEYTCPGTQTCQRITGGCTCGGATPRPNPVCLASADPGETTSPPTEWLAPEQLPSIQFNVTNLGPNTTMLTPGNTVTGVVTTDYLVPYFYSTSWGDGYQNIEGDTNLVSFSVTFTDYDAEEPDMLRFDWKSVDAVVPSFASVALNGNFTGDNTLTLCEHYPDHNVAWVDTTNGRVAGYVNVDLHNLTLFPNGPALLKARVAADLDVVNDTMTIRLIDFETTGIAFSAHPGL